MVVQIEQWSVCQDARIRRRYETVIILNHSSVFDNCVLYNGANSDVGRIGIDLQNEFISQCQKEKIDYDFSSFRVEP